MAPPAVFAFQAETLDRLTPITGDPSLEQLATNSHDTEEITGNPHGLKDLFAVARLFFPSVHTPLGAHEPLMFMRLLVSTRFRSCLVCKPPGACKPPASYASCCLRASALLVFTRLPGSMHPGPGLLLFTRFRSPSVCIILIGGLKSPRPRWPARPRRIPVELMK